MGVVKIVSERGRKREYTDRWRSQEHTFISKKSII